MNLGEVYQWETYKAQGKHAHKKFHIFVCPTCDVHDNLFLYINTMEWYKDYKLLSANYGFLTYDSFVGCNSVVSYTDAELVTAAPALVGRIENKHLKELRDVIIAAETMPQIDATRVCGALVVAI
jgi:hypothetical protein